MFQGSAQKINCMQVKLVMNVETVLSCSCIALSLVRYRHEFKSNELWTEIKLVLDAFALPLTNLFKVFLSESFVKKVSLSETLVVNACKIKT